MKAPEPDRVVRYPVTGDDQGGRLFVFGKTDAPNLVFFCAGYPDDQESFSALAQRLSREANCLCGVACLVGFDDDKPWKSYRQEGYTFPEMTSSLRAGAKALRQESTSPNAKLTCIFHDWGSGVGAMYTNQALEEKDSLVTPDQIVYFDVLPTKLHPSQKQLEPASKTLYEWVTEVSYRIVFALAFLIQRFTTSIFAVLYFGFSMAFLQLFKIAPSNPLDDAIFKARNMNISRMIYMAYPYYYMWRAMLTGDNGLGTFHLPLLDKTPVLYLYGTAKNIQFHDRNVVEWLASQSKTSKSNAIGVQNAAHWLWLQQPDICYEAVKKFILDEKK